GGMLNRGVKGDTVALLRKRLGEVIERRPARVFLMIGINDLLQGRTPRDVADGVDAIAEDVAARAPGTRLVLLSLLPVGDLGDGAAALNDQIRAANRSLAEVASRRGAAFVDLHARFADEHG